MKIGIQATAAFCKNPRGIGKTLIELYNHIAKQDPASTFYPYFHKPFELYNPWKANDRFIGRPVKAYYKLLSLSLDTYPPIRSKIEGLDLIHYPSQFGPVIKSLPTVTTVHDIIPLRFPEQSSSQDFLQFERTMRRTLKLSTKIITISNFSKRDILDYYPETDPEKITVIHWAPNSQYKPITDSILSNHIRQKYGVCDTPFYFALGGDDPRKNTLTLINSFIEFCNDISEWKLLIGGLPERYLKELQTAVDLRRYSERIILTSYLPDDDMPALYSAANAFIFPSLYEGFGLPILDAMACNCPVICSSVTSLPEIAGEAASYFNPYSTEEITQKLIEFSTNEKISNTLKQLSAKRVTNFSWENTSKKTIDVFKEAVKSFN